MGNLSARNVLDDASKGSCGARVVATTRSFIAFLLIGLSTNETAVVLI